MQSFENELSQQLEKAFCTSGSTRIILISEVTGADENGLSFDIDFFHMKVRLCATGEVGIIRRDTSE